LRATEADLLVETSASPPEGGQPGLAHLREALARRIPVVTSNKWPVALDGVALAALARDQRVPFRAESTVMSGTPVLSALTEGLAGARPISVRGLLNATVNDILTRIARGRSYPEALAAAQAAGLAGQALDGARAAGGTLKHVASLSFAEPGGAGPITGPVIGPVSARVQLEVVEPGDRLAGIDGAVNGLTCRADPVGEVTVIGPGAGPELAGQGVLSDLIAVARALQR
jgi:homoserine dehydrogenase